MVDRNKRKAEFQDFTVNKKTILNCTLAFISFEAKVKHILNKNVAHYGALDQDAEKLRTFKEWCVYKEDVELRLYGLLKSKHRRPDFFDVVNEILKLKTIDYILDNDEIYGYHSYLRDRIQKDDEEYLGEDDGEDDEEEGEEQAAFVPEKPYTGLHTKDCRRVYTSSYTEYPVPKGRLGALTEVFQDFEQELSYEICPQTYWLGITLPDDEQLLWKIKASSEKRICWYFVRDMTHVTLRYLIKHLYIRRSCLQALERLYKIKQKLWCASFDLPFDEHQRRYKLAA
jgi:hypothetical protein